MYLSQLNLEKITDSIAEKILFEDKHESVTKSDVAILCGTAPKFALHRAEIAADFYHKGGAKLIIASGSAVADKSVTESEVMHKALLSLGVPEQEIIEEPEAFNTIENMTCSLVKICKYCDAMSIKDITVITEPFHITRALALGRAFLPGFIHIHAYTQGTKMQCLNWHQNERLRKCSINELKNLQMLIKQGVISDIEI